MKVLDRMPIAVQTRIRSMAAVNRGTEIDRIQCSYYVKALKDSGVINEDEEYDLYRYMFERIDR